MLVEITAPATHQSSTFQLLFELCPVAAVGLPAQQVLANGKCGGDVGEVASEGEETRSQVVAAARNGDNSVEQKRNGDNKRC